MHHKKHHDKHHSHHKHHSHDKHKSHHAHGAHHEPHGNPDKGPPMMEGRYVYDKGYTSDYETSHGGYPEGHMRGNNYLHLQNEILKKDRERLSRDKFSKIA